MEIMANSDNVLRGGLTPKHIDVPELLENVRYEPTVPNRIKGTTFDTHEEVFNTPAEDFQLSRIVIKPNQGISLHATHPDVYFVYKGTGTAQADELKVDFRSGDSLLVLPGTAVHFNTPNEAVLYRATVPAASK
jgi:mannose-6-phosphate isomerase